MLRCWRWLLCVAAVGCADANERCQQIDLDDLKSRLEQSAEDRRVRDGGAYDPNFRPATLPTRPSDKEWYEEHCYNGKAR